MSNQEPGQPADGHSQEIRQSALEWANNRVEAIEGLVRLIGGEDAKVEKVLPPTMLEADSARQDAPEPDWTPDQIAAARKLAHEFGYGAEQDVSSGLVGGTRVLDGGLAWKVAAELEAVRKDGQPNRLVLAGSPNRPLRPDEFEFINKKYEGKFTGQTEYDFAKFLAAAETTAAHPQPLVEQFGYEVAPGNATTYEATGQLISLGSSETGSNMMVLRVDREDYMEGDKKRYRHQPQSEALMRFMADVLTASDLHEDPIGLATSNAYASRVVDAVRVGVSTGRQTGVLMYGRATMADVRDMPMADDTPLNQLPGDLNVYYFDKLKPFLAELEQ